MSWEKNKRKRGGGVGEAEEKERKPSSREGRGIREKRDEGKGGACYSKTPSPWRVGTELTRGHRRVQKMS